MRIGIDGRVLDRKITGTGRYLINLLMELPNCDSKNEYYIFTNSNLPLDKNYYKIIRYKESILPLKLYSPFWVNIVLPKLVKQYELDILFQPNVFAPIKKVDRVKYISVVHDSIYKIYNEYHPLSYRIYKSIFLPASVRSSDLVITVSEQSKKDLMRYDNIPENKLRIVHNTAAYHFKPINKTVTEFNQLKRELGIPEQYLLFVGALEKRKNVLGIIKILDLLREKGSQLKLVLVGKPGHRAKEILPEINKRKEFITQINFVTDEQLNKLYNYSFAFLFPSYYEGFGIPPLEAMQCGTPVLAAANSSLLEVVGDGGILHAADDYMSFVESIVLLENNEALYQKMKTKALQQAKRFSINKVTKDLLDVFEELYYN